MAHAFHLPFFPALLIAILSMAAKDLVGTVMTVAEARGSTRLAGHMDALGDGANIICNVVGAGTVILTGFNAHSLILIAAIMLTSDIGTRYWTAFASKHVEMPPDPRIVALEERIAALERKDSKLARVLRSVSGDGSK